MKTAMGKQPRDIVLQMLLETAKDHAKSHMILRHTLEQYPELDQRDRAFITRLYQGTVRKRIGLDYLIDAVSKTPVRKMKPAVREILRMSLYQMQYMDRVPDAAAVSEAVRLMKKRGLSGLSGFVNGVLRNLERRLGDIPLPDPEKEPVRYLSVAYAMPEWIVSHFVSLYGRNGAEKILAGTDEERGTTVRVNLSVSGPEELADQWIARGVSVTGGLMLPYALNVRGVAGIASLPGYDTGAFCVQDISSMLVGELSGAQRENGAENEKEAETSSGGKAGFLRVLDMCAAPGGKSQHMADLLKHAGRSFSIVSCDLSEKKVSKIRENTARFGADVIEPRVQDASEHVPEWDGAFDIVLADVPCSGLGVLGTRADLRHNVTPETILSLAELQKKILANAASYVKAGGLLIYSTCTVDPAENEEQTAWFTENYPFVFESFAADIPAEIRAAAAGLPSFDPESGQIVILPGFMPMNGFYIAKMRKKDGGR